MEIVVNREYPRRWTHPHSHVHLLLAPSSVTELNHGSPTRMALLVSALRIITIPTDQCRQGLSYVLWRFLVQHYDTYHAGVPYVWQHDICRGYQRYADWCGRGVTTDLDTLAERVTADHAARACTVRSMPRRSS